MERQSGRGGKEFAELAEKLLYVLVLMPDSGLEDRHRGGVLVIRNRRDGQIASFWYIGRNDDRFRLTKCGDNATEKGRRLHFLSNLGRKGGSKQRDVSSYQSRSPEDNQWGGAIRGKKYIYSFSGLPELADEALMTATALLTRNISHRRVGEIARASNNQLLLRLLELLKK